MRQDANVCGLIAAKGIHQRCTKDVSSHQRYWIELGNCFLECKLILNLLNFIQFQFSSAYWNLLLFFQPLRGWEMEMNSQRFNHLYKYNYSVEMRWEWKCSNDSNGSNFNISCLGSALISRRKINKVEPRHSMLLNGGHFFTLTFFIVLEWLCKRVKEE